MATIYTQRTYTESDRSKQAKQKLEQQEAARPADYESQWLPQLNSAVDQILNREAFQYDLNSDPLYQQYRDNYVNQGRMAMLDTMGQAATLTGGYGNSYAQLAGQQAYQTQLQGLNNVIPELYQLALDTYDRRGQNLLNQYGVLSDREGLDYGRYIDALNLWNDQLNYLAGRYDTERGFDYTEYRDMVGDDQWKAAFDEDIRRYDYEHRLGEFAPVPGVYYEPVSSGGSVKKPASDEDEEEGKNRAGTSTTYAGKIVVPSRVSPNLYTHESY